MTTTRPDLHLDLPLTGVAKIIRTELKKAQKAGTLPEDLTFSIRTAVSGCDGDITVTVKGFVGATHRPEWLEWSENRHLPHPGPWQTPQAAAITRAVKAVCAAHGAGRHARFTNAVCFEQTGGLVYA